MHHPYLFALACFGLGYIFPEWIGLLSPHKMEIPISHNITSAVVFGALAIAVVFP